MTDMRRFFLLTLLALCATAANAYDFSAVAPSGHALYFKYVDGGVQVTYPGSNYNNQYYFKYGPPKPTGALQIPDSVQKDSVYYKVVSIGAYAFWQCSDLTSVAIPNSVRKIEEYAFYACKNITSLTLPDSLTSIGASAFWGCKNLTSLVLPNSVSYIGEHAFASCEKITSVVLPDSLSSIGYNVFNRCRSLEVITIPDGVTSIGTGAFEWCDSVKTIVIGNGVDTIGLSAFEGCNPISITFGSNINYIGDYAFHNWEPADPVFLSSTISFIGQYAFNKVKFLYYYGNASGGLWNSGYLNAYMKDSLIYSNSGKTKLLGAYSEVHNPVIPGTVTEICDKAFKGCKNITAITIPTSVNIIRNGAFSGCSNLTTVNYLSPECQDIGDYGAVFEECVELTTVNIGTNVTRIPSRLFLNCAALATIHIPSSVTEVGVDAFKGCDSLSRTYYGGTLIDWCNIVWQNSCSNPVSQSHNLYIDSTELQYLDIPSTITGIGNYAFYGCQSLSGTLTIPSQITSIGDSAFAKCTGINTLDFEANYCTTASFAFSGCLGLDTIIIGSSVAIVPDYIFRDCNNVSLIMVNRSTPPGGYQSTFFSIANYIPVYVPCNSLTAYYNGGPWEYFTNIEENCETVAVTAIASNVDMGSVTGGGDYPIGDTVQLIAVPYSGYRFVHWSNGSQDNPLPVVSSESMALTAVFGEIPIYDTIFDTTYIGVPYAVHDTIKVHDTAYVEIPYAVHDTTTLLDTAYVNIPYAVHDTTYIDVYVHDTTIIVDTLTLTEYVPVHDTTYIDMPDTTYIYVPYSVHDTTYIEVHDTTYMDVPYAVHDTTIVVDTLTQYVDVYVHDTTIVIDTVTLTEYVPVHDTTYIDVFINDTTVVVDTVMLTQYDTVTYTDTLWLTQHDTLWLHDTVIVHDTVYITEEGIDGLEAMDAKAYYSQGQIVVEGAEGNKVTLYDASGRVLATRRDDNTLLRFDAPASGAYMIKIGSYPARKVVVIR